MGPWGRRLSPTLGRGEVLIHLPGKGCCICHRSLVTKGSCNQKTGTGRPAQGFVLAASFKAPSSLPALEPLPLARRAGDKVLTLPPPPRAPDTPRRADRALDPVLPSLPVRYLLGQPLHFSVA